MAYQYRNRTGDVVMDASVIRSVAAAAASAVDGMAGFCVRKNGGETKLLRGNKRTDKAIRIDAAHGRLNVTI